MNEGDYITALSQAVVWAEIDKWTQKQLSLYIAGADPYDNTEYKRRKELLCLI